MKVAIVGTGISGLVSAYLLDPEHDVTVFEARDRIGGHTHTVTVDDNGVALQVDTGFIVFNDWTYPNFIKLLERLGIGNRETEMSFSVQDQASALEYSGTSANTMFAQRRNLFRPRFWKMIREIMRFNQEAPRLLESDDAEISLQEYLDRHHYSDEFRRHYIIPMGGAIWSSPNQEMYQFPAKFFIRFFKNHGMLSVNERPQWRVVEGGASTYVDAIVKTLRKPVRVSAPVHSISRADDSVTVRTGDGLESFDEVIIASHSDQALTLLSDPTDAERDILGKMRYVPNDVVLHTDTSLMPRLRRAWASWNAYVPTETCDRVTLTYDMNILQGLETSTHYLVTLNDSDRIAPGKIIRRFTYAHPLFTPESVAAQGRYDEIGGKNRTHFCGAYWFNGFHEDGVRSALRVCEQLVGPEKGRL